MNITEKNLRTKNSFCNTILRNTPEKDDSSKDGTLIGATDFSLHFLVRLLPLKGLVAYKGGSHPFIFLVLTLSCTFYLKNSYILHFK